VSLPESQEGGGSKAERSQGMALTIGWMLGRIGSILEGMKYRQRVKLALLRAKEKTPNPALLVIDILQGGDLPALFRTS